jgi:hypothetical protein
MLKSNVVIFLLALSITSVISSCQTTATATPTVKKIISQEEAFGDWLLRAEKFNGILSVDVKLISLKISDMPSDLTKRHSINLLVTIKNISPDSVVVKKPTTIGINGAKKFENDLTIVITRKDSKKLNIGDVSNYPEKLLVLG